MNTSRKGWLESGAGMLAALGAALTGCSAGSVVDVPGVHMAELNGDGSKVYLSSAETGEIIVVDATQLGDDATEEALRERAYVVSADSGDLDVIDLRTLEHIGGDYEIESRIAVGDHPTHLSMSPDGMLLAVMVEGDDTVSFIDTTEDVEIKRVSGFYSPHFLRWGPDGRHAYVANINANHVTRVDVATLTIDGHIALEGFDATDTTVEFDEGGFADAQIDKDGILYAAHAATGRVLVYDTLRLEKLPELPVGQNPWIVFAEHPFSEVPARHLGPNFGDATVSMIDGTAREVVATLPGDREAYGVNYSSRAPDRAFVMNRIREEIAVVDLGQAEIVDRIPVDGNTETASTTPDGRWIVATVSSADGIVVIDAETHEIARTFESAGRYPWSVTILNGQNYCH